MIATVVPHKTPPEIHNLHKYILTFSVYLEVRLAACEVRVQYASHYAFPPSFNPCYMQ